MLRKTAQSTEQYSSAMESRKLYKESLLTTENDTAEKIFHNSCDFSAATQPVEIQSTSRVVCTASVKVLPTHSWLPMGHLRVWTDHINFSILFEGYVVMST